MRSRHPPQAAPRSAGFPSLYLRWLGHSWGGSTMAHTLARARDFLRWSHAMNTQPTAAVSEIGAPFTNKPIALIGAPTDAGASDRGSSMGPEALRVAQLAEALIGRGLQVIDRGNLNGPHNPW